MSEWGVYQMSGNVWEWCDDWFDADAYGLYRAGNLGRVSPGSQEKVLRGGSFFTGWRGPLDTPLRGAARSHDRPDQSYDDLGFRVARDL